MCYLTLRPLPSDRRIDEPGEDNARPQLNELPVKGLKHDYGKNQVVLEEASPAPLQTTFLLILLVFGTKV